MMTKTLVTLAAGAVALAGLASAAEFAEMDGNGDGLVTREEFAAAFPGADDAAFMAADTNADGGLTEDELEAARESGVLPAS